MSNCFRHSLPLYDTCGKTEALKIACGCGRLHVWQSGRHRRRNVKMAVAKEQPPIMVNACTGKVNTASRFSIVISSH